MQTVQFELFGMVQGVGMRFFIARTAKRHGLNGYVRNRRDGSVECIVQGKSSTIDAFETTINNEHPGAIERIEKTTIDHAHSYQTFEITH